MKIDLLCPVENQGVIVKTNAQTGEPYALFKLFNLSDRVVEAVAFTVHAYDAYGGELGSIRVDLHELGGQPKAFFASSKAVSLAQFPEVKHVTTEFSEVHFTEGDPYIKEAEPTEISLTEPDYEEKIRLISAAGEDAACYARDEGPYWVCVCGRPNLSEGACCARCGRDKAAVMKQYGSKDALNRTLAEQEEAKRLEEETRRQAEAEAKAARNKKIKKIAVIAAGTLAAVVVLGLVVNLAYSTIRTLLGNSAAEKGDYLAAYTHYAAAGNSGKLAAVSEELRGNSGSNLLQLGILAADEENLFYIDPTYAIYKESKATGEKTRLGDAEGLFLNVLDGWVYYVDAVTGQGVYRISTDGAEKELLFETTDSYFVNLALVGNELYFVLQEPQGGETLYRCRLYRLTIGKKKPKLVSKQDITQFICYQDRIYYLDSAESAICSMNRRGGDVQKLVSGPVYSFDISNDVLYYTDGTPDATTGQPKLSLAAAQLDGTYQETLIDSQMVVGFGNDGEDLYYIGYTGEAIQLYKRSGGADTLVADGGQQFNSADGYLMYIGGQGQLMKTTYDKSGVEEIAAAAAEEAPAEEIVIE